MARPRKSSGPGRAFTAALSPTAAMRAAAASSADKLNLDLITALEALAHDETAPASARNAAARTVLEVRGQLGKHAKRPDDDLTSAPLSVASRADLELELSRTRQRIARLEEMNALGLSMD